MVQMMDNVELIASIIDEEIRKILEEIAETPLPEYAAAEGTEERKRGEDEDREV